MGVNLISNYYANSRAITSLLEHTQTNKDSDTPTNMHCLYMF